MSTTTDTQCRINGPWLSCPSGAAITWDGVQTQINTDLQCPLDTVDQSNFIRSSQLGICNCGTSIQGMEANSPVQPVPCDCYACPFGSRIGFAIWCDEPIIGPCSNFSCAGECNGLFDLDPVTFEPTAAPGPTSTETSSDAFKLPGGNYYTTADGLRFMVPTLLVGFLLAKWMK